MLSDAHVLANEGMASPGDGILQPGPVDGGAPDGDSFARLSDFVPFEFTETSFPNLVDAAIAKVRRRSWVGSKLRILDITPAGVRKTVRRGMHIKRWVGPRTTPQESLPTFIYGWPSDITGRRARAEDGFGSGTRSYALATAQRVTAGR